MKKLCSWTNGQKAVVHLVELPTGEKRIVKIYKPGFVGWMFREYLSLRYVSKRLPIIPKLICFRPSQKELVLSYIPGQRVLEWVLQRFGEANLNVEEFLNFEAMGADPRIVEAFVRFRLSASKHELGWQHGTCDPRNVIYDEQQAYIIDFDHARPSLAPVKYDYPALTQWFGIVPD
jgi:hypothetical protein